MSDLATITVADAQLLTQRIKLTATTVRDNMTRLWDLVGEAKRGSVHVLLGFPSWTAYLADTFGEDPLRLNRDERQEVVAMLASEGMSNRAIAPIVGATEITVRRDRSAATYVAPEPAENFEVDEATGEVIEAPADVPSITGLDGKQYRRPEPQAPRRRALTDSAKDAGWELRKAVERLERIREDDRFSRNKNEVAPLLRSHLIQAVQVCQDLLDEINAN